MDRYRRRPAYGQFAALIPRSDEEEPPSVRTTDKPQRTLSFSPVTAELAADLLMNAAGPEKDQVRLITGEPGATT